MAEIIVKIKKGKATFEVNGVQGQGCEQLTAALEEALGTKEDIQRKPEYYVELDEMHQKLYE
jgi:hypothetical protein